MIYVPQEIYIGEDFYLPINWYFEVCNQRYPFDISGYVFEFTVKESVNTPNPPLVDVSSINNGIIIDGPNGKAEVYILNSVTSNLPYGRWVYDLKVTNTVGLVERLFGGPFIVKEMV